MRCKQDLKICVATEFARQASRAFGRARAAGLVWLLLGLLLAAGCASHPPTGARAFDFNKDTFAYANELVWEYHFDPQTGARTTTRREPKPQYTLHCFVVARSAKQFFATAQFDATLPKVDADTYRRLVARVIAQNPRELSGAKVVIPGYPDLKAFSADHAALLQAECGGAWQSYLQRGHWRMIMPFSRGHQEKMAAQLVASVRANRAPVVHVVRFPQLSINHAMLLFDVAESDREIVFGVYDPNEPAKPTTLTYDRRSRTFNLPVNLYFQGGRVDVYEIYRDALN
jgi:hypothetical protein